MKNFYVVYNIGCSLPGSECYNDSYEIFNSEKSFLYSLEKYIEYAKSCLCDVDEGDETELNQWFEDNCYSKERYEKYLKLIDEKRQNPSIDNGLYENFFGEFDVEIIIRQASNDYKAFIDRLYDDFSERLSLTNDFDYEDEVDEDEDEDNTNDLHPIMKYVLSYKKTGEYPSEDEFVAQFRDYKDFINESARTLDV